MSTPQLDLGEFSRLLRAHTNEVNPSPTALEVAILDFALTQHPEPIYGYSVQIELEQSGLRDPTKSGGGIYRALGACSRKGWLDRDSIQFIADHGPARVLYRANETTAVAWLFGIRSLLKPTVVTNFGRGSRAKR